MKKLGVNIDHIATLREARNGNEPDPVSAASIAEMAGADGIVVHLREDRRHIKERDLNIIRQTIKTRLLLEMAPTDEMLKIAIDVQPDMVSLVPEQRMELTTEGGLNIVNMKEMLKNFIPLLQQAGISVSVFIEPDQAQIKASHMLKADFIEIHTGGYANSKTGKEKIKTLDAIIKAARFAAKLGMGVNAGHGLNYFNIQPLVKIREITEFNIGHSIISRAVLVGLDKAVSDMKKLICTNYP